MLSHPTLSCRIALLAALQVFANRAMQSRAALQREADNWLEEAGTLPPGGRAAGWHTHLEGMFLYSPGMRQLSSVGLPPLAFIVDSQCFNSSSQPSPSLNMHSPALCWLHYPGNGAEAELWEGSRSSSVDASLMSADELAEYEDKKLKLRKVGGIA